MNTCYCGHSTLNHLFGNAQCSVNGCNCMQFNDNTVINSNGFTTVTTFGGNY